MEKQRTVIILIGIAIVAFFLRWYLMPSHLFFGPEQGRDFLVIRDIVANHKLTLIGSKTDIDGVFHGPLYYYLAAIPFALFRGDPIFVFGFFVCLQSLSVFLVYALIFEMTKKRRAGYIGAVFFAVSYLMVVYSRWLSNPQLSIPLSLAFMLFLFRFIRGKPWALVGAAFMYGLLGQAEFINYLLFAAIGGITCIVYWKQLVKTQLIIILSALIVGFVTSFATYILFDVRHDFLVSRGITNLLLGKSGVHLYFVTAGMGAFRVLFEQVSQIFGLWGWVWGGALAIALLFVKKERMLMLWFIIPPVLFSLLRHPMLDQLYAGVVGAVIILAALGVEYVWEKKKIAGIMVFAAFVILNSVMIMSNLKTNYHVFIQPQQPSVRYTDQLHVVDWAYKEAAGRPFEIQSYTIPYFLQQAWIYLFDWRGQAVYGYMPTAVDRKLLYVIIQKDRLDPLYQKNWYDMTVTTWGKKTKEFTVGEYTVEERMRL